MSEPPKRRIVISFDDEEEVTTRLPPPPAPSALWEGPLSDPPRARPAPPPREAPPGPFNVAPAPFEPPVYESPPFEPPAYVSAAYAPPLYAPLGPPLSGWWTRALAFGLDALFGWLAIVAAAIVVAAAAGTGAAFVAAAGFWLVWTLLYFPLTMTRGGSHNGQTFGKQICSIRVVREDGGPLTVGTVLVRELLFRWLLIGFLGAFLLSIPPLLDVLWPLWDDQNQALHDKGAGTLVVKA